ncbi:hypothetical protein ADIWIN_1978 [Winogradskyella psychrotolerans RS-3]|uniref:Uncharacterized protein n=1 Tax=Winogradskyella psychrotolerans RS-3 TaxID=641526 RepID=S7VV28_9FLAO|nr:hypothetical protein ADIWIN_1978 [Winogradskyella psychrotolerans RS-3]
MIGKSNKSSDEEKPIKKNKTKKNKNKKRIRKLISFIKISL